VYVYLDAGVDEVSQPNSDALISRLEDEVRFLREELARKDHLLAAALERIPSQLEGV
jgi:hypothetical protein